MNYYEIETKSTIASELLDYAFNSTPWVPYYNFSAKPVSPEIIDKDKFFKWLHARYKFLAGILKMDPYTCYDWHKDTRRGVGINMLLTPPTQRQACMFKKTEGYPVFEIEELRYRPITYYVFNTQAYHTVYNFETTRYLLSIEFLKDKDELTFDQLVKDIKDNYEKNRTK